MTTTAPSIALLAFFPLASTSTCTAEFAFSEDSDRFASAGTVVLPISVDSVPTLREFKAKHGMKLDLLELGHRRDDAELLRQIAALEK